MSKIILNMSSQSICTKDRKIAALVKYLKKWIYDPKAESYDILYLSTLYNTIKYLSDEGNVDMKKLLKYYHNEFYLIKSVNDYYILFFESDAIDKEILREIGCAISNYNLQHFNNKK